MILYYYASLFIISVVLTIIYALMWHKHFDVHLTIIYILVPIANMAYCFIARAKNLTEALVAQKIVYIGATFMIVFMTFSIFSLCKITLNKIVKCLMLVCAFLLYGAVLTIGSSDLYYIKDSIDLVNKGGVSLIIREYGPVHTIYYIFIIFCIGLCVAAFIYSYFKKRDVSHNIIFLQALPVVVAGISFFGGRMIISDFELAPVSYVFAQLMYILISYKLGLYDVNDSGIDSLVVKGDTGFISIDFKLRYLGCNETAQKFFPHVNNLKVDKPITIDPYMTDTAVKWIEAFKENEEENEFHYEIDDRNYQVNINYLYDGRRRRGYQFFITDDTADQQYINLLNKYNTALNEEVNVKTQHIIAMHDNLIMGMATMVESRDNSTGGHIKRTSMGVRMLIDEMRKDENIELDDEFCRDVIKAAPMHDLGKIAVDDEILRKPGKFTDEEFAKMKEHAAEGAKIVHSILESTDDESFKVVAENVAHYHHERWDGSGYPEGLKGEQIPLEARIMAIADVYDALVSKRVYKDKMSFEKADSIIMEGMGKHFDKGLEKYYVAARPKLEKYYSGLDC